MQTRVLSVLTTAVLCSIAALRLGGVAASGLGSANHVPSSLSAAVTTTAWVADTPITTFAAQTVVSAASALPGIGAAIDVAAAAANGVSPDVLRLALGAVSCASQSGAIGAPPTLTLIDYSRPSVEPRLWVFDLSNGHLLFKELVAHGRNTGDARATRFSNVMDSRESSLGLFVTDDTYVGSNGYSLRLDGLEPGFNDLARERAIVMHGAAYVDARLASKQGRIGRSWGCPALRNAVAKQVIDSIRGGGVVFSYYPDPNWLSSSRFIGGCNAPTQSDAPVAVGQVAD